MYINVDEGFSDRVLRDTEMHLNSNRVARLMESRTIKKWLKFYKEWFGLDLKIEEFHEFEKWGAPGAITVVVPKEVTLQKCFDLLKEKIQRFEEYLKDPDNTVQKIRKKNGSYIAYEKYGLTLLELLAYDLFLLYQGKSILTKSERNIYKSHLSYMPGRKSIHVTVHMATLWEKDEKGITRVPTADTPKELEYKIWPSTI